MGSLPRQFFRLTARWERFLYRFTASVLILLIIAQMLMLNDRVRSLLNRVEYMEGVPFRGQYREEQGSRR